MDVLYESGGEDIMEAPMFESPLQDTVVLAGSEVVLKCIITGIPLPEGKWPLPFLLQCLDSLGYVKDRVSTQSKLSDFLS